MRILLGVAIFIAGGALGWVSLPWVGGGDGRSEEDRSVAEREVADSLVEPVAAPLALDATDEPAIAIELSRTSRWWLFLEWRGIDAAIDREGLTVDLRRVDSEGDLAGEVLSEPEEGPFSGAASLPASSIAFARFLPDRLPVSRGRFELRVSRGSAEILVREFEIVDRSITLTLDVPSLDRRQQALVAVTTRAGLPLDAVEFAAFALTEKQGVLEEREIRFRAVSLGDGLHRIVVLPWVPSSPERIRVGTVLEGRDAELGRARIDLELGTDRVQPIVFEPRARALIELLDYVGHPLQGGLYVSYGAGLEPKTWQTCFPDPLGRVPVGPFPPGPMLFAISSRANPSLVEQTPLFLAPGENFLSISLPRVYSLDVHSPDHSLGTEFRAVAVGKTLGLSARTGLDGVARFDGLQAGKYVISPAGETNGMLVEVTANASTSFIGSKANGLLVEFGYGGRAAAGIEEYDIILAVDGEEFADLRQLERAFLRVFREPPGTIRVERRGGIEEIVIEGDGVSDESWDLEPTLRSVAP